MTKLTTLTSTELAEPEPVRPRETTPDWKKAFAALAMASCTGFVNSMELSKYVDFVRIQAGDEPADFLVKLVNSTRSKWMQDFMG